MLNWTPNKLLIPSTVLYGPGILNSIGPHVKKMGKKALIVSDEVMLKAGYIDQLTGIIKEQNLATVVFHEANFEPTTTLVEDGLRVYNEEGCDFIIALGGGSPIDTAKAIGAMSTNSGKLSNYMGVDKLTAPIPPVVAIATTAGTGSEATKVTIITDLEKDVKMLIISPYILPTLAVVDPLLTISVPQKITAATGIDALCHAAEAFISVKSQPFTDDISLAAIRRISKFLRIAWANGEDIEARSEMMLASLQAGIAFSNSSVTIIHGMSRPLGANFHIPHGLSNAVLLPVCMEYALMGAPERFAKIAEAMGENINGLSTMAAAKAGVEAMKQLCHDLKIPSISELGIDEEKYLSLIPKMAEDALISGSPGNTPRKPSKEDIMELYKMAFWSS